MVGRYHVETYTSGGHKYHRLARSYRDENGRPRKERLVHLGRAATPEEALAAIEKKMEKLYASKYYDALIEAEAGVKRLEDEIKEAWGGALAYWHNGEIPSEEDVLHLRRVGRRRQKVTDPEHERVVGAKHAWVGHPEYRWDVTPEVVKSREPLHYEYRYYADDFTVDIGDRWPLRFLDFLAAIRRLKRKRAEAAEEVSENRFKIAGGEEGMKVCWQVTGTRKDPWAAENPFVVEQVKPEEERGRYLDPSLYDAPEEQRVMIGPIAEAVEERPPEPSDIDFARLQEEHRREMEELRRRMEEREGEAPPEST